MLPTWPVAGVHGLSIWASRLKQAGDQGPSGLLQADVPPTFDSRVSGTNTKQSG